MARNKLKETQIRGALKPGKLGDGDGLYLHTSKTGGKSWVFVYIREGKRTEMGLGPYGAGTGHTSLADARVKADVCRACLGRGGDPKAEADERKAQVKQVTFGEAANAFLESMESGWRNEKHRAQWKMTLGDAYCASLRKVAVAAVDTNDVLKVLEPAWKTKAETASRLRGRIESVLAYSKVRGWRTGENPARWKEHLDQLLPPPKKLTRGHHAAMDYADVPAFLAKLRQRPALSARALELAILTAARTGEIIGATWDEIDFDEALWAIPKERMKAKREHRVPLSEPAIQVLRAVHKPDAEGFVFPGPTPGKGRSNMAMDAVLRRMGIDVTVHGFRSSFRDWAGEETTFPREVAEAALAHVVGDQTERAYRCGDALKKRRELMDAWASYLEGSNNG